MESPRAHHDAWNSDHLSRRLCRALDSLYKSRWEPSPDARIVKRNYSDLDKLTLRRALKGAGLPSRTLQNLRATASSLLKSWGVAPEYVRTVIGHESQTVADAHYDRLDFTAYRQPEPLHPGENPMDLFARLCRAPKSHHESHHRAARVANLPKRQARAWRSQRESNPCLSLERAAS